jgi:hypothetical protein
MLQNNVTRVFVPATIIALMSACGCAGATAAQKTLQGFASDQASSDLFRRSAEEHRLR